MNQFTVESQKLLANGLVLLAAVLCLGCDVDVESTLEKGQRAFAPVIVALEKYKDKIGRYPSSMNKLVDEGYLIKIPSLPDTPEKLEQFPLNYSASPDCSFYMLQFAYDFPEKLGPGAIVSRYYISIDKKWDTAKYPPRFENIVAKQFGDRFKKDRSFYALRTVVECLTKAGEQSPILLNMDRRQVQGFLGNGEPSALPKQIVGKNGTTALSYRSINDSKPIFIFVYAPVTRMAMNKDGSFSDRKFQMVQAVFEVNHPVTDSTSWKLLAERQARNGKNLENFRTIPREANVNRSK